jgi:hypothetical protein
MGQQYGRDQDGVPYWNLYRRSGWTVRKAVSGEEEWTYTAEEELVCVCKENVCGYRCTVPLPWHYVAEGGWCSCDQINRIEQQAVWGVILWVQRGVTCQGCGWAAVLKKRH